MYGSVGYFLIHLLFLRLCTCKDELLSVVVLYRHGDRTPVNPYPNDPYKNISYWPVDFGQLTNKGKLQHYELGQWFRNRYTSFLPHHYSETAIHVISTDVDRTLMSAESNLAGLYPPTMAQQWMPNISWQPIPIHTIPLKEDGLLSMNKPCPKYDLLMKDLLKTPFFRKVQHKYHDLYSYLSRYTGNIVSTPTEVEFLYNNLFVEYNNNLTLPVWTKNVYPDKFLYLSGLSFSIPCFTKDMARLRTGPLLHRIIKHFENATLRTESDNVQAVKFLMLSAHDVNVANVLKSLDLFEEHSPPYTSTILLELRKLGNSSYVNLFYKNTSEPRQLILKGCDFNCDFQKFIDILQPITLSSKQWEKECVLNWIDHLPFSFIGNVILVIGISCVLLLIIGLFVALKISRNRSRESSYIKLPDEEYA